MPLKRHESILIFSKAPLGSFTYNPIMVSGKRKMKGGGISKTKVYGDFKHQKAVNDIYYPQSILYLEATIKEQDHPTLKPVPLLEYFILTYTNPGDMVLDNCAGSGTTGEACINTGRNFILIEKEASFIPIINDRITRARPLARPGFLKEDQGRLF